MIDEVFSTAEDKMKKSIQALNRELDTIRTGRATPALVDSISVDVYGVPTPLNQIAAISVPEARLLVINPWDKSTAPAITKAIQKSDLGLNPINDGNSIRLIIPSPTEERRKELVKVVKKKIEDSKIAIRNVRREAMEELKKLEKDKDISQDENRRASDKLQKLTDSFVEQAAQVGQSKETEIMEV